VKVSERRQALIEAAEYAEFYANERMTLCGDTILHDPVLRGERSQAAFTKSRDLQIDGTINSSAYHAAMDIAGYLRKLAEAA
jgi:hypothetical protein